MVQGKSKAWDALASERNCNTDRSPPLHASYPQNKFDGIIMR